MNDVSDDCREHSPDTQRTHTVTQDEYEASLALIDCSECGRQFNLGAQSYYGPRCPNCRTND